MPAKNPKTQHLRKDKPNQPIAGFVQEADNLYNWCLSDLDELSTVGISKEMIDELTVRNKTCREAEAVWKANYAQPTEAQILWKTECVAAKQLRKELLATMRYAFHDRQDLLHVLASFSRGNSYTVLIQNLNDIAHLGKQHIGLLEQIAFDSSLLDLSASKSKELAELWAESKVDADNHYPFKVERNKAFWHLHELVSQIRAAGKFVFRNNPNRLKGYTSSHWKHKNQQKSKSQPQISMQN